MAADSSGAINISRGATGPEILVIHTGGNDLCLLRIAELISLMRSDINRLPSFPKVIIVCPPHGVAGRTRFGSC